MKRKRVKPKMQQASATHRAFALPEIGEAIFLLLTTRDLLVNAQRVNKAWHNTIKSPIFQRLLFFEPWPRGSTQDPQFNPLLLEAFPHFFTHSTKYQHYQFWAQESLAKTDWASSDAKIDAYQRKEASWRQMLPIHPPVKRMDIIKKEGWQTGSSEVQGKLLTHRGLEMGVLYDFVEEEAHSGSHFESTSFDLEWHVFAPPDAEPAPSTPTSGPYVPPHARKESNRVTVHLSGGRGCCPKDRDDYLPPAHLRGKEYADMTKEEKREYAISEMYNARPHLRSLAFTSPPVEWEEKRIVNRWH